MSLWNVNDETTRLLMTTFYKQWAKTKDIRKSFEMVQNPVKSSTRNLSIGELLYY
jgi:hypothetical protein